MYVGKPEKEPLDKLRSVFRPAVVNQNNLFGSSGLGLGLGLWLV